MSFEEPTDLDTKSRAKRPAGKKVAAAGKRVGLIGLGAMGMGVAKNLLDAGFELHACDISTAALNKVRRMGALTTRKPSELAGEVDTIMLLVVNAEQTETVLFGEDGAAAVLPKGGTVVVSCTMPPAYAESLGERLAAMGLRCIDAPVSGGAAGAAAGTMTIMAAGAPTAMRKVKPVFDAISSRVYKLGDTPGMGSKVKMINQLLAGVHIASSAEAMALGIRAGIDPETLYDVISNSAGSSWMFQNRVPHILAGDYTPTSAVEIFVKDLGIVLDSARSMRFPLPLTASAHQMFLAASAAGLGAEDDIAIVKNFERLAGIQLPAKSRRRPSKASGKTPKRKS
ncbi:MAG: L-threonate dehydrogenase [Burkholderiaceae bacterium]